MKKLSYLSLIIILMISCSKELDRGNAEDMIIEHFSYPYVEFNRLPETTSSEQLNSKYQAIRGQKLMSQKRKGKYGNTFYILLSETGKTFTNPETPYQYGWNVATNLVDFKEITGIRFNDAKTVASVEYLTEKKEITPFGELENINEGDTKSANVNFVLYDDGWRIDSKPKTVYKKEHIIGFDKSKLSDLSRALNEITIETGKSPCIIKDIYKKYGTTFVVVDYTKLKDNRSDDGYTDNYENNNPKLRTFMVNEKTQFLKNGWEDKDRDDGLSKIKITDYVANKEKLINYPMWNIYVNDGIISDLIQVYFP